MTCLLSQHLTQPKKLAITSATTQNLVIWQKCIQITTKRYNIMKNIFLQTPSKAGVLLRKTFFHTPDEARSVGLAKACILQKIYSVKEKLDLRMTYLIHELLELGQLSI